MQKSLTDNSFDNFIEKSTKPVLVEFWAAWCIPCNKIEPVIKEIAYLYKDKINFVKVNSNSNPVTLKKYNIKAFPTLILFKEGKPIATQVGGVLDKNRVTAFIDSNV